MPVDATSEWIIPNSQGDIRIYMPGDWTIIMKLSGGSDSAILAYMLAKYRHDFNPNLKFVFVSSVNRNLPYQYEFAKKVVEYIDSVYPLGDYVHLHNENRGGEFYKQDQNTLTFPLHQQYNEKTLQWVGITCNPPVNEMKKFGMYTDERVIERDPENNHNWVVHEQERAPGIYKFNRPFINHDKRGVAELYTTLGVLDDLFPLTRSCEEPTHDFSKHCGKCWFCLERKWGYGTLDPKREKQNEI